MVRDVCQTLVSIHCQNDENPGCKEKQNIYVLWKSNILPAKDHGGCFTNISQALQNKLAKICNARKHIYGENFTLKLCTCAQSMALGTSTKFQLEILMRSIISTIHKFRDNILESSRSVTETTPRLLASPGHQQPWLTLCGLVMTYRGKPELTPRGIIGF